MRGKFFTIVFIVLTTKVDGLPNLYAGQCPLLVPSSMTTKIPSQLGKKRPHFITIAHRGASDSLPEHTLPAYRLALELGADYIEADLVATKDNKLVSIHGIDLNTTTNVALLYPERHRTITLDGKNTSGYFVFDFTLEEVQTLRVKQRIGGRSTFFDFTFSIPTIQDIVNLLHDWNHNIIVKNNSTKRSGIYAEFKNPQYYLQQLNISLVDIFLQEMDRNEYADKMFFNTKNQTKFGCERMNEYQVPPLVIQCFDIETLREMRSKLHSKGMAQPSYVLLANAKQCHLPDFWSRVDKLGFLSGIGPDKKCVISETAGKEFINQAQKLNLAVHPYTSREEIEFVTSQFASAEDELRWLYCSRGITGMFVESLDLGVKIGTRGCEDFQEMQEQKDSTEMKKEGNDKHKHATLSQESCSQHNNKNVTTMKSATWIMIGTCLGLWMSRWFSKIGQSIDMGILKKLSIGKMNSRKSLITFKENMVTLIKVGSIHLKMKVKAKTR
ncbi:hypothetical protein CTEN210_18272 [Chaetoceros tenuissimus]|uniref:glycerophosphodiester phosphodiesterase n=1 Tax=Chaetoceros tenuissimus TaxID=426638 RepID=A0AAD3DCI3_9STRA|nr:hypothetical protein CTEN210_18272 [Chaetoceros tenuissimus]